MTTTPTRKITITFKDPDGVFEGIQDYVNSVYDTAKTIPIYLPEEDFKESLREVVEEKLSKFIEYSEYLTVEFDLDNNTARIRDDF